MTLQVEEVRKYLKWFRFLIGYAPLSVLRSLMNYTLKKTRDREDVTLESVKVNGVPAEWISPFDPVSDQVLLYIHGGAFVIGWNGMHRRMLAYLTNAMNMKALAIDYRLAPEHRFPAALDDCLASYKWLLEQGYDPSNIVVAGDSAGGNLAISMLMSLRDSNMPLPAAVACLSPVIDLTESGLVPGADDDLMHRRATMNYCRLYVTEKDLKNPLASPRFGMWKNLPPMIIHAGGNEFLVEDAIMTEKLARESGVEVELRIFPDLWHVWQTMTEMEPSQESLHEIGRFLVEHIRLKNCV